MHFVSLNLLYLIILYPSWTAFVLLFTCVDLMTLEDFLDPSLQIGSFAGRVCMGQLLEIADIPLFYYCEMLGWDITKKITTMLYSDPIVC